MVSSGYPRYEFRESDAWDFARHIGTEAKQRGRELNLADCPYCHGGTNRERYKFSINLDTGQYKCLRATCGATGNMLILARDFDFRLRGYEERPQKAYKRFKTPEKPIEPKPAAIQYLEKRGISANIAKKYEITVQKDHENVLVFPFYDENGVLTFVKYRKTDFDKTKDKNKEWCEAHGKPILFGMKQCKDRDRLVITEGQLDSLAAAESGIENAVSVPTGANGFTWVPHCWDFMSSFSEIVVFGDHENGDITLLGEITKRFGGKVKHVRAEDYKDCKDANEILLKYGKDAVRACVENAVFNPVECVVDVADVVGVNPHDIEKMATGIGPLDKILKGGLPFGYYHIITGRRGEGKSTLASQFLAEALDQGYSVFAYSGEMPVSHFKACIDFQLAGAAVRETEDGKRFVSKYDKAKISDWYRGRLFAYDIEAVTDEKKSILTIIDEVIRRYGVRVILIDNLMTAVDLDADARANKYDAQGEFAKRLSDIARKYNVLILLVAHRRKQNGDWHDSDPNDDIGGSSYVSNLCGDIIGYSRPTKKQLEKDGRFTEHGRVLTLTKNRLFGNVCFDGLPLVYQETTKRISGELGAFQKVYGWAKDAEGFEQVAIDDDGIPWGGGQ